MKKSFNKIKTILTTLWIAIISFSSKVIGIEWDDPTRETLYWVQQPETLISSESEITLAVKIAQIWLTAVIFIVWIVNFVKIRKMDDRIEKQKKIRTTVIVLAIFVLILITAFLIPTLLLK